jgi:hypothetical protein
MSLPDKADKLVDTDCLQIGNCPYADPVQSLLRDWADTWNHGDGHRPE